ncbi:MAG: heme exporter protein CcmD [Pseudomonadota bacterium]
MTDMLAMGNYGAYVWTCFGLTFIVMVTCVVQARSRQKRTYEEISARIKAMESKP